MDQFLAVMLLVGCSSDQQACAEIAVPTPFYSTIADCRGDLALQMRFSSTYDDRVLGTCTAVDEAMLEQSGTIEWAVNRGGQLIVEIRAEGPRLASAEGDTNAPADDWTVAVR